MADRNEHDRGDARNPEDDATGGKDDSLHSEATPGAERDRETAYDSSTSGGAAGEIQEASDTPAPTRRGRDMDH